MHKYLKNSLEIAHGESHQIISVVADVRGFSQFSRTHDSVDVATYVSKLYLKLLEQFSSIDNNFFAKTTGDGLLLTFQYHESTLKSIYNNVVNKCIECCDNFSTLLGKVPIINFDTPTDIGFGVSRGSACALTYLKKEAKKANKQIIDYSGHKVNLAARLQDLARPFGVVLEGSNDLELLSEDIRNRFKGNDVYIRSIAEKEPTRIWTLDTVKLSPSCFVPLAARWESKTESFTSIELSKLGNHHFPLGKGTICDNSVSVRLQRKANPNNGEIKGHYHWRDLVSNKEFAVINEANEQEVVLHFAKVRETHDKFIRTLKKGDKFDLVIKYQVI